MKGEIWAISTVCNEDDIVAYTFSHLLMQGIDHILVCDHCSDDNTSQLLEDLSCRYPGQVTVTHHTERAFFQSKMNTELANQAYERGAEWILPVDADELFYSGHPEWSLGETIRNAAPEVNVIGVQMINHYQTSVDEDFLNPYLRIKYRHRDRNPLEKMITRWRPEYTVATGNHSTLKGGVIVPADGFWMGVRHFAARSAEQWIKKNIATGVGLGLATGLSENIGAHARGYYKIYEKFGEQGMKDWYYKWFYYNDLKDMIFDPAPYRGDWR